MSIEIRILGQPGADNSTLLQIDSGSATDHLLFDCGAQCLDSLSISEIHHIDHLFFSHFHMDHICGFDTFFRHNYCRANEPVTIWGPTGTIELIHHRMLGYTWNLHEDLTGEWIVNEVVGTSIRSARFYPREAFGRAWLEPERETGRYLLENPKYSISTRLLNHGTIGSLAYRIDEPDREHVDSQKLESLGLKPGAWIRDIKENKVTDGILEIDGKSINIADIRADLLTKTTGKSAAYLTDFISTPGSEEWNNICDWIRGVDYLICEGQYRETDNQYAEKNYHMTTRRVGQLAADAGVGKLIIQHVSRRYESAEWLEMLAEAQSIFPAATFPENWLKVDG